MATKIIDAEAAPGLAEFAAMESISSATELAGAIDVGDFYVCTRQDQWEEDGSTLTVAVVAFRDDPGKVGIHTENEDRLEALLTKAVERLRRDAHH